MFFRYGLLQQELCHGTSGDSGIRIHHLAPVAHFGDHLHGAVVSIGGNQRAVGAGSPAYVDGAGSAGAPQGNSVGRHELRLLEDGVENYDLVFEQEENCDVYHTNADSLFSYDFKVDRRLEGNKWTLKHSDFDTLDALFFNDAKSKKVSLVRKDGTKHLTFDFNGFDVLVIWTMPGKKAPYLCLEPWNGLPALTDESGKFSDKPYLRTLKPGEEYSVSYNVKV